ncbi:MAG: hypothetical protein Q4C95_07565 [Planctomycetia bacterium]|nr:hypothetical protein [Planctomycetia bacterium]
MSIMNSERRSFYQNNKRIRPVEKSVSCLHKSQNESQFFENNKNIFIEFLRNFILIVSLIGIPLIAIFWDQISHFKEKTVALLLLNNEAKTSSTDIDIVVQPNRSVESKESLTKKEYSTNQIPIDISQNSSQAVPTDFVLIDSSNNSELSKNSPVAFINKLTTIDNQDGFVDRNENIRTQSSFDSSLKYNDYTENKSWAELVNDEAVSLEMNIEDWEQKLQKLGAFNIKKERWGQNGEFWRLSCQVMPFKSRGEFTQFFEATETEYSKCLMNIVQVIESWQNNK